MHGYRHGAPYARQFTRISDSRLAPVPASLQHVDPTQGRGGRRRSPGASHGHGPGDVCRTCLLLDVVVPGVGRGAPRRAPYPPGQRAGGRDASDRRSPPARGLTGALHPILGQSSIKGHIGSCHSRRRAVSGQSSDVAPARRQIPAPVGTDRHSLAAVCRASVPPASPEVDRSSRLPPGAATGAFP